MRTHIRHGKAEMARNSDCSWCHLFDILTSLFLRFLQTSVGLVFVSEDRMTNASDTFRNLQAGSDLAPLRAKSGWIVALGVVYLLAGFVALGSVVMATVASVLVVGVMMII